MRIFFIIAACVAIVVFFSYDRLGELTEVFSSRENNSMSDTVRATEVFDEKKDASTLFPNGDISTDTEERLDQSIKSVEDEIRRTEEFLQKKQGDSAR
ncbi:hypothetical protein A2Z10_03760 [Candidatus Azambacteria bacterium RBG_16_47_10]|uniref:Uncharacterized protein n=1 Tax=Candidatus Azambacteria bacterium RBG_16_47_10 TaxID=1797292 RepID=A0A1F5AXV3_9BACT|nr:MAG: hypothetical protein A2Z10_03760 [Candidatus Azambacteria bacterium RBG_16_47_10]